ncbi:MAG: hypothetical protein ACI9MC_001521 [Kiritimatiellia bacterium]
MSVGLLPLVAASPIDTTTQDTAVSTTSSAVATPPTRPLGRLPPKLAARAHQVRDLPIGARMAAISELMLESPYHIDPLGEGRGVDKDPLARYDRYDCLTFLEEVLALSIAGTPEHAGEVRLALRYRDSNASYQDRRHFMELQWIPDNIAAGWLKDTTQEYGPTTHMVREVDAASWNHWNGRSSFALADEHLPIGTMELHVLSLDDAITAAPTIRPGSIILTVRENRTYKPIWISHVGFMVPNDERPTVRHATRMQAKRVIDHGLVWYLKHLKTYKAWPAEGIAILEPVEQGPRRLRRAP